MLNKIFPFLTWLPIAKRSIPDDLIAGLTNTVIVIPQAVAFAMIAGLPPIYGFYTAMVLSLWLWFLRFSRDSFSLQWDYCGWESWLILCPIRSS
jgi:MFS superfamily sulfate permease-like transporter